MNNTCGCCEGIEGVTPVKTLNRPGLSALLYRVGTHASFFETMLARLSSLSINVEEFNAGEQPVTSQIKPLMGLTTRDTADPAIAMLDAWAIVADVLTFYQERIANEGFLRTATERLSVLEMARLVGYRLRPGLAASVYLAYTLEKDGEVTIPVGSRSQTVPGPGELPQSFETADPLDAREEWNVLTPRMTRPQKIVQTNAQEIKALTFEGIQTNLKPNDALLFVFGDDEGQQVLRMVEKVDVQTILNRTQVTLQVVRNLSPVLDNTHQLAESYLDLNDFKLTKDEVTVKRVVGSYLQPLRQITEAELPKVHEMLPGLRAELATAQKNTFENLEPWLAGMVTDLDVLAKSIPASATERQGNQTGQSSTNSPGGGQNNNSTNLQEFLEPLQVPASTPPPNSFQLDRKVEQVFDPKGDIVPKLLTALQPALQSSLYQAMENANVTEPSAVQIYALRVVAPLFGYNTAPTRPQPFNRDNFSTVGFKPMVSTSAAASTPPSFLFSIPFDPDWHVVDPVYTPAQNSQGQQGFQLTGKVVYEEPNVINLDTSYDKILPDSWLVIKTLATPITDRKVLIAKANNPNAVAGRAVYGMSGKTTRIELGSPSGQTNISWLNQDLDKIEKEDLPIKNDFNAIRTTVVYAQSELLTLAEEPIDPLEEAICDDRIVLDSLYEGLEAGRWLIVSGERTDIPNVPGVKATELVMLAGVEQSFNPDLPGDKIHTEIRLSTKLAYCYKRDAVTIYGNVVRATHGETRSEVIGSGNSGQVLQKFTLKGAPLTYLASPTPRGDIDTLEVRVNDVLWHEAEDIFNLQPRDHSYVTQTDDEDKTTVIFGDGQHGARLPTGVENVKAVYRTGIGQPGNAAALQISQLASRPLGVKEVINPQRASGGADREDRDAARKNAPMGVMSLDRLISVQDYEDFARTFAGIGKASAARLSDGRRQVVHLTIAGLDDIPIDTTSDLYLNLRLALLKYGDPSQALQLALRYLGLLVIRAGVRVQPDYKWESVEPLIRAALLDAFGFDRRELGQSIYLSEVISTIQNIEGVEYVLMEMLDTIKEDSTVAELAELAEHLKLNKYIAVNLAKINKLATDPARHIKPAELVFLSPDVPDTLYLYELNV
jgi:hypothetical protein